MSRTVTALYDTRAEADAALAALSSEISLAHGEIIERGAGGEASLERVELTPEERENCERQMRSGDYMLLAQVRSGEDPAHIVTLLERIAREQSAAAAGPAEVAEERIPVVEEELRVGRREVVRGGARVTTRVTEVPASGQVELIEEFTTIERRPATRRVGEAELEQGGLLRERVIEISQIREEAVVSKEAFVREEVVVKKSVERRVEQIDETVRRTEVETERLDGPAFTGLASGELPNQV
ncbi:MAG TPA: YsnF/AvaK domain-containing protein [Allosphingosinicella sp.]|jgi:stress response protein YsnF